MLSSRPWPETQNILRCLWLCITSYYHNNNNIKTLHPSLTWWPVDSVCRSPACHLMSVFLPTLMDDLWSTVTKDNSPLISLRFLARYNKSWWSMTSSIGLRKKPRHHLFVERIKVAIIGDNGSKGKVNPDKYLISKLIQDLSLTEIVIVCDSQYFIATPSPHSWHSSALKWSEGPWPSPSHQQTALRGRV